MKPANLVEMVWRTAQKNLQKNGFLVKVAGEYTGVTYKDFWTQVTHTAAGLAHYGIGPNDHVAILSDNNPFWAISDIAIMSLGAVSVPIHSTLPSDQISYILKNADCKFVFVENQKQLQKIQAQPDLEKLIIYYPDNTVTGEREEMLTMKHLMSAGEKHPLVNWEEGFKSLTRDDLATIIHTSGTTGFPKGAMLTHGNILSNVEGVQFWVLEARPDDIMLSHLPLSHIFERMAGQFFPLSVGATIAYAENIDTVQQNLLEVQPTVLVSVPLLFEKVYAQAQKLVESGTPIRRKVFDWALKVGETRYQYYLSSSTDAMVRKSELPKEFRRKWKIADKLVYQKVKKQLGGRIRGFISGGGALNPEIGKFFWSIDLPVLEGYGLTETSPVICVNPFSRTKVGTVGKPLPNLDVHISDDGEVLVKGPSIMKGYYQDEDATSEQFDNGWFKTGDIGEFDEDGFLRIVDRKKRIIVLTSGKNIAPQPIENALHQSIYIENAVLVGQNQKYVIALLTLNFENLKNWCKRRGIHGSVNEIITNKKVQELITREVNVNTRRFARYEQPKKLIIVNKEWTVEGGELTPSLKVRYKEMEEKYKEVIEQMYEEDTYKEIEIAANEVAVGLSLPKSKGD